MAQAFAVFSISTKILKSCPGFGRFVVATHWLGLAHFTSFIIKTIISLIGWIKLRHDFNKPVFAPHQRVLAYFYIFRTLIFFRFRKK